MAIPRNPDLHFVVGDHATGLRLDRFLSEQCPDHSRARIQDWIREQHILVNGKPSKPSEKLPHGAVVEGWIPEPTPEQLLAPKDIPLDILFEDEAVVVINKPAGLVVHPGSGTTDETLVHALLHHCSDLSGIGGVERPGIVHRLDKETSGCMIVAKNDAAHRALSAQFAERTAKKTYLAVVRGIPRRAHGCIDAPIGRHRVHRQKMTIREGTGARDAITEYQVLARGEGFCLLECRPKTGRTHQIRVHLKQLGHPILGDPLYGNRGEFSRHLLHAWKLDLRHPISNTPLRCTAPPPSDFPLLPPEAS